MQASEKNYEIWLGTKIPVSGDEVEVFRPTGVYTETEPLDGESDEAGTPSFPNGTEVLFWGEKRKLAEAKFYWTDHTKLGPWVAVFDYPKNGVTPSNQDELDHLLWSMQNRTSESWCEVD